MTISDQFLTFTSSDFIFSVQISVDVVEQMHQECICSAPKETGGVLVGYYSEDLSSAYVIKMLGKSKHSIIDRFSFVRKGRDYLQSLDKLWDQKQYYVGEWHYHPYSSSSPSPTDINTLLRLSSSEKLHCPEPILIIIGGQKGAWDLSVSVFSKGERIILS